MKNDKLKIAYLSDSFIPSTRANTVHVIKMCAAFAECGADVVLYGNNDGNKYTSDIFSKYGVSNTYKIITEKAILCRRLKIIEYALRKRTEVIKQNPDICYGRSLLTLFLLRNRFTYIYESHIYPNRKLFVLLEKILLKNKRCMKLVVISQTLKDEYLKTFSFLKDSNILVLHDGADKVKSIVNDADVPSALIDAHTKEITIGYIGHLYPGKCMETLIPVAKLCSDKHFHILGGVGEWVSKWEETCHNENIANVHFYGFIDNSAVNDCYRHIDIVILPFSKGVFFNKNKKDDIGKWISPLKLFEAMANGKAIISSNLPSIKEVISDGIDGILVPAEDPLAWKKALYELIEDGDKRQLLGKNAREKLEVEYTWKKRAEKVLAIIRN